MRNVVCPHCNETVQCATDLAQAHCVRCGGELGPTNTQITAAPSMRTPLGIQPIDQFERNSERSSRGYSDWDEFRNTSPAVQRELMEMIARPLPDLRRNVVQPLPEDTPAEVDAWSNPLGSLMIPGESWFSHHIGCLALEGIGFLMIACGILGPFHIAGNSLEVFVVVCFNFLCGGLYVYWGWRIYLRDSEINREAVDF